MIDTYSYRLGAADVFCEMIRAGVKKIALSHPCDTREARDSFLSDFDRLCQKYGVHYYVEDEPIITDLFPVSMNRGKYQVIFYQNEKFLQDYLSLKEEKLNARASGYYNSVRSDLAYRYGKLLSYTDEGIRQLLTLNTEKEP